MNFLSCNLKGVQIWGTVYIRSPSIVIYPFMWNKVDQHLIYKNKKRWKNRCWTVSQSTDDSKIYRVYCTPGFLQFLHTGKLISTILKSLQQFWQIVICPLLLQMRKLRHRQLSNYFSITWLASDEPLTTGLNVIIFIHRPMEFQLYRNALR